MSETDPDPVKPTLTDFQRFAAGAEAIQAKCACIRWDPRECYEARYRRPMDDVARGAFEADDECECRCHDELRQLEEDIWGPEDR